MPTISIVLSFYKPSTKSIFVFEKAIENLLNQTFKDFELIIINDGGRDGQAIKFVENIKDPRVTFLNYSVNSGGIPAKRYNEGIRLSKGKYIFYGFEDDIVKTNTLELLHQAIEINKVDFSYAQTIIHTQERSLLFGAATDLNNIFKFNFIPNNLILHKKEVFGIIGPNTENKNDAENSDWKYWQKMIKHGFRGSFVPEVLGENFGPLFKTNLRRGK